MSKTRNWNREELLLALNLYLKLPFGRMHARNAEVAALARVIGRTPASVAMRLTNFASLDPAHVNRGVSGLGNVSKDCVSLWNEYRERPEDLIYESEVLNNKREGSALEELHRPELEGIDGLQGLERERWVKTRVNQAAFRQMTLANYGGRCAVSGLGVAELLMASHIVPWASDPKNRLNPANGLCLSALYDRAFDRGLIGIDLERRLLVSENLRAGLGTGQYEMFFKLYEGRPIAEAEKYPPHPVFIAYHLEHIFIQPPAPFPP